jgi:hypothetical protein
MLLNIFFIMVLFGMGGGAHLSFKKAIRYCEKPFWPVNVLKG